MELNDSIWEIYSPSKAQPPVSHNIDIIFFHGLQLGDFEDLGETSLSPSIDEPFWKTWRSKDDENVFWPKDWLSKKLPTARILSASYNSSALQLEGQNDSRTLGENLVTDIIDNPEDIGQDRPVFLVGHSLGGIVIKQFVKSCIDLRRTYAKTINYQKKGDRITEFLENLNGVFYYATPHDNSGVADMELTDRLGNLMGTSPILGLLKVLGTNRVRLNDTFEHHRKKLKQLRTFAVAEGMETTYQGVKVMVVPQVSALQGSDEKYVNTKANHFTVCQAAHENDSAVIGKLVEFIRPSLPDSIL